MATQPPNGAEAVQPIPQAPLPYAQNPNAYGQTYTPYAAAMPTLTQEEQQRQMMDPMNPFSNAQRPPETKARALSKDILHAVGFVIAIICFGLSLSTINSDDAFIAACSMTPMSGLAFLWSGAELITRIVRKREAGIHPGAHVGVTLLIWLGSLIVTILCAFFVAFDYYDYNDCSYRNGESSSSSSSYSNYDDECYDPWGGKRTVFIVANVFSGLIFVIYFAIFIIACIGTARRNKWAGLRRVIYVAQPGWPNAGWQKMENHGGAQYQPVGGQAPPMVQAQGTEYLGAAGELSRGADLEANNEKSVAAEGASNNHGSYSNGGGSAAAPRGEVAEYYTPQG